MPRTTMTLNAWTCLRCPDKPHVWPVRGDVKPLRCPSCGSCYWDRPRKKKEEK